MKKMVFRFFFVEKVVWVMVQVIHLYCKKKNTEEVNIAAND